MRGSSHYTDRSFRVCVSLSCFVKIFKMNFFQKNKIEIYLHSWGNPYSIFLLIILHFSVEENEPIPRPLRPLEVLFFDIFEKKVIKLKT